MSVRSAEGTGADGADMGERRTAPGQRVHFEALVAVGEARGGGFEAESVDVSPDGMRLRAAYLPEVGDKLVCRFDGAGSEVVAEGEVTWRNPEARGGEFGLRFAGLDAAAEEAIRGVCVALTVEAAPDASKEKGEPSVSRGARVRLHIDGLGSPMKARVRESASREVEVGSNLEFLKVGRPIEIEDVDKSKRREAWIESVKVDVDPATRVPQLVVALRYDEVASATDKAQAKRPSARPAARSAASAGGEVRAASDKAEPRVTRDKGEVRAVSGKGAGAAPATVVAAKANGAARADAEGEAPESSGAEDDGVGARAARAGRAVAGKIAPTLADISARARGAMGGILAAVQRRRDAEGEGEVSAAPRRTTAPAPGGGLKTEGRRLVRDEGCAIEEAEVAKPPRNNRRAAAMGGALGLVAVLAVVGGSRFMAARSAASATAASTAAATASGAEPATGERVDAASSPAGALPLMALPPGAASVTPVANVPLFGATPLSTTEAVPPPPSPSTSALAGSPPAGAAAEPGEGDDDGAPGEKSSGGAREWGQGSVQHPVTLKLKMDGPVERINGAAGAMGFTLSLPDRRALSTSQDLARKDKRLASVNVINTSHGAEVTVQFKDGVPAYLARAKGDRLEILLGSDGHKKVAKKKKGDEPSKATASKKKSHK
jgi:PilZ domain